tara:strand:+ start:480 stop:890 length:411 start_codon:yes stop_codon:yes gene_type:complete
MCFFKMPEIQMPTVEYVGPSQDDIDAQNQALTDFQNTLTANNQTFQTNIQNQITKANESTTNLMTKISEMNAQAAAAADSGLTSAPYAITTEDNADQTDLAQTTATIKDKKKPTGSLKITQSGIQSSAGTGVNYGV